MFGKLSQPEEIFFTPKSIKTRLVTGTRPSSRRGELTALLQAL